MTLPIKYLPEGTVQLPLKELESILKENKKLKQKIAFKKELKNALISVREVMEGKQKEVTLNQFLESCEDIELWNEGELKQISTLVPTLQTNEDFLIGMQCQLFNKLISMTL